MDGSSVERHRSNGTAAISQRAHEIALRLGSCVPHPASGQTLLRWRTLFDLARENLSLVKLVEAHLDALAIFSECGWDMSRNEGALWAVWAAKPPADRLQVKTQDGNICLEGNKHWCSGAHSVSHALVTCDRAEESWLAAVTLDQPGISVHPSQWANAGMSQADTCSIRFQGVPAALVGGAGDYTARPGFWQGAIGIAACWLGGAAGVADTLRAAARHRSNPHLSAHLGAVDALLTSALAGLRSAAAAIDAAPFADCQRLALSVRATVEECVIEVIERTGRALGAGPLCVQREHAQRVADLLVFVRQSHSEHDLESLGTLCAREESAWAL